MWGFIVDTVLPLLATVAVGAFGWWLTHWIANPIVEFERTRKAVREEMYFTRHVQKDWHSHKIEQAEDMIRRLAARIEATSVAVSKPVCWYFQCRHYNLSKAYRGLNGLANAFRTTTEEKAISRHDVEIALRLPTSESPERIEKLQERIDRDG